MVSQPLQWSDVSFTIDGVSFPCDSVEYRREPDYGCDLRAITGGSYEVNIDTTVPVGSLEGFASLFQRKPRGASHETLAKRVRYGGRKGRSAWRRLLRTALPIEITTATGDVLRGQGVMLDETELQIQLRGGRRAKARLGGKE